MPRDGEPRHRVHLWLPDRDVERAKAIWPSLTLSAIVQRMLRTYLDKIDATAGARARTPAVNIDHIIEESSSAE